MRQVGALSVADELARHVPVIAVQVFGDFTHAFRFVPAVMHERELVPRMALHGLQTRGFAEGLDRLFQLSERRMAAAQAVPGLIQFRAQTHGFAECIDGARRLIALIVRETQVVPSTGVAGPQPDRLFEQRKRFLQISLAGEQKRQPVNRARELRIVAQRGAQFGDGALRPPQKPVQPGLQIMAPGVRIHGGQFQGSMRAIVRRGLRPDKGQENDGLSGRAWLCTISPGG